MASAEDYRKYAEQCMDMAEHAAPEMRETLVKMAETWLQLATTTLSLTQKAELDQNAPTTDELK